MQVAKQVADILTLMRASLVVPFVWLGLAQGVRGLPAAIWLLMFSWISDALDGPVARRSRVQHRTWVGDHDLQADMLVSVGLLIYMLASGFVNLWIGGVYAFIWALVFIRIGVLRALGMLFQAPVYGWFIFIVLRHAPAQGLLLVGWIAVLVLITWPRFPREVVPDFLNGMKAILVQWLRYLFYVYQHRL